ncbi:unnamed protein product [Caenorhabditis angaria]|uniref:SWIRM domain-containing protein n=1 Tax=Caenorhabditis angaria TaxID=860376 RepID=A0A9P1I3K8_9PELO|nr:unnamed protein product [Caenorhabditis angaria]
MNNLLAFRVAAERSRLPYDRPTDVEYAFFPEIRTSRHANTVFLLIRNTALKLWLSNPLYELEIPELRRELAPPFNSDSQLIENVHNYLSRYGLINVGIFKRSTGIPRNIPESVKSVVVIGAGVAGISAALQLTSFGFDVTIIEGREEIGGRVRSIHVGNQIMEIGADTFRSSRSNAMTVLIQQLQVTPISVDEKTPMYADGKFVDVLRDKMINATYTACRDSIDVLTHNAEQRQENGLYISRQRGFENVLNLIERESIIKYYNFWKILNDITEKRENHYQTLKMCREIINMNEKRLTEIGSSDPLLRRSIRHDISVTLKKFEENFEKMEECEVEIHNARKAPSSKQAMHPSDFRYFNFYLGHEEFVFGAPLEQVQMSCDAVKSKLPGASLRVKEGVSGLLERLVESRNMDVRLNHRVQNINYEDNGVKFEQISVFAHCQLEY